MHFTLKMRELRNQRRCYFPMTALLEVAELKFGPRLGVTLCLEFIPFIISESLMSLTTAKMKEGGKEDIQGCLGAPDQLPAPPAQLCILPILQDIASIAQEVIAS